MLKRCYSVSYLRKNPSYYGTVVCDEWLTYSNFKQWCITKYIPGYELDKDIIGGDKKIYSPETCCFVPTALNGCLKEGQKRKQKENPLGTSYHKKHKDMINERSKPYEAQIKKYYNKSQIKLGMFKTAKEAHKAWQKAKRDYLLELIEEFKNDVSADVIKGLQLRVDILEYHLKFDLITKTINKITKD